MPGVMKDHWEAMASFDSLGKVSFGTFFSFGARLLFRGYVGFREGSAPRNFWSLTLGELNFCLVQFLSMYTLQIFLVFERFPFDFPKFTLKFVKNWSRVDLDFEMEYSLNGNHPSEYVVFGTSYEFWCETTTEFINIHVFRSFTLLPLVGPKVGPPVIRSVGP